MGVYYHVVFQAIIAEGKGNERKRHIETIGSHVITLLG